MSPIFTMENKRAKKHVTARIWNDAKGQLEKYLNLEHQTDTDGQGRSGHGAGRLLHGAVAVGMRVRFY